MGKAIRAVKGIVGDFFRYWNSPKKGRYLPNKEAAAYCVGGMGVVGATVIPTFVTLSAGMYIAAALHIKMDDIILVGIISTIVTLVKSPIIGMLFDNTWSKKYGKFHPYMIWMPVPLVVCAFALGWVPYLLLNTSYAAMLVSYIILYNVLQIFMGLYSTGFLMTVQVISPSPEERTWLMSVGTFVYSLGPSIVNGAFPLLANLLFSKDGVGENGEAIKILGVNDIRFFQWIVPIGMLLFCALGYLVALGTKERTVVAKEYKQKISFFEGMKQTVVNKYFWITNISTILSVFKIVSTSFIGWICTYIYQNSYAQALVVTIMGSANIPGMLLAPWLIKKFGNRNIIIITNLLSGALTLVMLFFMNAPILLLIMPLLITMVNGVQVVTGPLMTSQLYDYQQYKTGERLEGFLSQFGALLGTASGLLTALVQPYVCKIFGYVDDPSVLYRPEVIQPIMRTMLILSIISSVLGALPIFFWDISEKRHHQIMDVLRVRADKQDGLIDTATAQELEVKIEAGEENVMAYREKLEVAEEPVQS